MKSVDDEARKVSIRKGAAEHSFGEVARSLATGRTMSRRQALGWIGGALAGAALARFPGLAFAAPGEASAGGPIQHGAALPRGIKITQKGRSLEGRFGLMFKKLPAFQPPDELLRELAGAMNEDSKEPKQSSTPDSSMPAGFVFLGQFIDHDLTFDTTPLDLQRRDPDAVTNFRAARFELDSVYGAGPSQEERDFYDPDDPAKLNIDGADLPRRKSDDPDIDGTAIIGDPRDDENLITSQLHLAFRKFHNALVDYVQLEQGLSRTDEVFAEAQRLCRWHYQWMVVHDFLPRLVGQQMVDELLQEHPGGSAKVKLGFYKPKNPNKPMMPIEFAVAAYRFGHSMIPKKYVLNEGTVEPVLLFGNTPTEPNLSGGRPLPKEFEIDWQYFFFDVPDGSHPVNYARKIDSVLSDPLFNLPPVFEPRRSLAERNLLRGKMLGLASGQRVAQEMGAEVLTNARLGLGNHPGWQGQAPLWFYILKEAEQPQNGGEQLGTVGGRIVAEVFLGLLERDANSYLRQDPSFRPQRRIASSDGRFGIVDLLKFAGVVKH